MTDSPKKKRGVGRPLGSTKTPKKKDLPSEEIPSKREKSEGKNKKNLIKEKTLSFLTENDLNEFNSMIKERPTKQTLIDIAVCHYKFPRGIAKTKYAELLRDFGKKVIEIHDTKIFEEALRLIKGRKIIQSEDGKCFETMGELLDSLPQLVKKFNTQAEAEEEKNQDPTQPHDQIQELVGSQEHGQEESVQSQEHQQGHEPVGPQDSAQVQPEEQKNQNQNQDQDQEVQEHEPVRTKIKERPTHSKYKWDLLKMDFEEQKAKNAALFTSMAIYENEDLDVKEKHKDEKN